MSGNQTTEPDPKHLDAAKAIHAASPLGWLRWDQLPADCKAEYLAAAAS